MTDLRIERMSATVADWPEPDRVPQMLRRVCADRLEDALRERPLPDGEWCVRRLDVALELDPERPLSALETDWADRIVTALRLCLRDGSQDVVRYVRPEAAVDDLLAGLATARYEHAWAWRQVGLLEPGHPEPHTAPAAVLLSVLGRLQHGRVAALARLVQRVGVAAVHRLLGRTGWLQAAVLVAAESGTTWLPVEERGAGAAGPPAPADVPARTKADRSPVAGEQPLGALPHAIVGTGGLAAALRASRLRVDPPTLQAWAILAIAAADPCLLRASAGRLTALAAAVGVLLQPTAGPGLAGGPAPARTPSKSRAADPGQDVGQGPTRRPRDAAHPSRPDRRTATDRVPEPDRGLPATRRPASGSGPETDGVATWIASEPLTSRWGGLLYLLNSAADAGLPELLDEPPFLARPAPWVMRRLGLSLVPVEPADPALLAFAGASPWGHQQPPDDAEQAAIEACAARWTAMTARRLRGSAGVDEPADVELVRRIAGRAATIAQEPGWVEVGLRLDEVDLDVRRAGLDVDPGWVWWLGQVVRFRYE